MARLEATTIDFPRFDAKNYQACFKAQDEHFRKLQDRSNALPEGEVVGALIKFSVADGYAVYLVTKAKPLTLQHIPYGDGYQVHPAMIRGLNKADVLHMVKGDRLFAQLRRA